MHVYMRACVRAGVFVCVCFCVFLYASETEKEGGGGGGGGGGEGTGGEGAMVCICISANHGNCGVRIPVVVGNSIPDQLILVKMTLEYR